MEFSRYQIQEWVAIPFSRGSSWPRYRTQVCIAGRFLTIWATREAYRWKSRNYKKKKKTQEGKGVICFWHNRNFHIRFACFLPVMNVLPFLPGGSSSVMLSPKYPRRTGSDSGNLLSPKVYRFCIALSRVLWEQIRWFCKFLWTVSSRITWF